MSEKGERNAEHRRGKGEGGGEKDDLPNGRTACRETVVQVRAVGGKGRRPAAEPSSDRDTEIGKGECGEKKTGEREDLRPERKVREGEPEKLRPRVSHKESCRGTVEGEKAEKREEEEERGQGVFSPARKREEKRERKERGEHPRRGKSVRPVGEVDGVDQSDGIKEEEREGDRERKGDRAREDDDLPRDAAHKERTPRRGGLEEKFFPHGERARVVEKAGKQEKKPEEKKGERLFVPREKQERREKKGEEERHAAEPRRRARVRLPHAVRQVHAADHGRKTDKKRAEKKREKKTKEGEKPRHLSSPS